MPPRSIPAAAALIGLSTLAAVEGGGCDNRAESLRSVSRTALPLVGLAVDPGLAEGGSVFSDYGLSERPELKHVCGHYALRDDGRLATQDVFASQLEPDRMKREVTQDLDKRERRGAGRSQHEIHITVESAASFHWPRSCPRALAASARSVVIASRVL